MKRHILLSVLLVATGVGHAQADFDAENASQWNIGENIHYQVELQCSFADDKTPLWLHSNQYGLSSLEKNNGYLRAALIRPLRTDSARKWAIGYGLDVTARLAPGKVLSLWTRKRWKICWGCWAAF